MFRKKQTPTHESGEVLKQMSKEIIKTFIDFGTPMKMVDAIEGIRNFHFYLQPEKPTRMKTILNFKDDLRYALSNNKIEIEAPIPDKKLIGITVPKPGPFPIISLSEVIKSDDFTQSESLIVPLGVDEFGAEHYIDIARTPHMLIAGTTGSGKSALVHSIINSLLAKNSPEEVRFIFCDPKRTELTLYSDLPHMLTPTLTEPKKSLKALLWAVKEMSRRYDVLQDASVQGISYYHELIYKPAKEAWIKAGSVEDDYDVVPDPLPYIVIIIDEINDLMQAYPKELEALIVRLAQMARAVGIHMIISTQRPSVNVITGSIKANIPTRIAMSVASQIDSRTIIDMGGAEKLTGEGDMLLQLPEQVRPIRIQAYYLSDEEVGLNIKKFKKQYREATEPKTLDLSDYSGSNYFMAALSDDDIDSSDDLYEDAKQAVIKGGMASTSFLQRKLRIGYSRAARLMDLLEAGGVIGPVDGARPREVLEK